MIIVLAHCVGINCTAEQKIGFPDPESLKHGKILKSTRAISTEKQYLQKVKEI